MSRGVGYIAGVSLDDLESQWSDLLDQNVDVILFDRMVLKTPHKPDSTDPADIENNTIWQWSQSMAAGQDVSGNFDRYRFISDLQSGDALVLVRLNVLFHAYPGAWSEFLAAHERGVHLIILEYGFHSGGEYGDVMLEKMSTMFELGTQVGRSV
jgi:hypothetical protein